MEILKVNLETDMDLAVSEAVKCLKVGGVIIYPTDTIYGIGCNALDDLAVSRVYRIKHRSNKPLSILARDMVWVHGLANISPRNEKILNKIWPGKYTAILPKKEIIPAIVTTGLEGVGIRVPQHEFIDRLLKDFGYPITSTSANISGEEYSQNIEEIIEVFKNNGPRPDLIIDAGPLPDSTPSVVIDLTSPQPKILRVGPSKPSELLDILGIE